LKIGLVRHFKVKYPYPRQKLISAEEVTRWFEQYDLADIEPGETDLCGIHWPRCYSSDMPRAIKTANIIFSGPVRHLELLREIPAPLFKRGIRLPFVLWAVMIRFSWLFNRQTRMDIRSAKRRVADMLDELMADAGEDALIVSHAALMVYMRKELLRRGFKGPKFTYAENGKLYLFSK